MEKFRIEKTHWKMENGIQFYKYHLQVRTFWGWRYATRIGSKDIFILDKFDPIKFYSSRLECIELIQQYKTKGLFLKPTYEYIK
jgi:hypothetical protein